MPVHRGTDVFYQISLNTVLATGNITTTVLAAAAELSLPNAVIEAWEQALEDYGEEGEGLATKPAYATTVKSGPSTSYSYYAALSTLGRSLVFINNDTQDDEPWIISPEVGVFATD
jgi:hypothetical protein